MGTLNEIRKNIGAIFYHQSIGNQVDRNGKQFLRFFYLNEEEYAERFINSIKYIDNFNGCSLIPNTTKGDRFKQSLSVKNVILCEDEARETPCVLYCWGCVAKDNVFYKIGITNTRHVTDKSSDIMLITKRINWTIKNFRNAGNGNLNIYPLFIVKSSVFNCMMLEKAIHKNSVFNGDIAKKYYYFSGINECCRYLDFKHLDRLRIETSTLNDYEWVYFDNLTKIDFGKNYKIIQDLQMVEYSKYLQDWHRLKGVNQLE